MVFISIVSDLTNFARPTPHDGPPLAKQKYLLSISLSLSLKDIVLLKIHLAVKLSKEKVR